MLKYTICFIRKHNRILLLNRQKGPWMGAWNGVGGKLEAGETPLGNILREVREETGLVLDRAEDRGAVTWEVDGRPSGGMHLFYADISDRDDPFRYPMATPEGILDWKEIEWILHPDNKGLAANLTSFLPYLLNDPARYEHRCDFRGGLLHGVRSILLLDR